MFYNKMVNVHTKLTEKLILGLDKAVKEDVIWGLRDQDKLKKWSQKRSNK